MWVRRREAELARRRERFAEPFYARIANGKETMARFLAGSIRILVSTSAAATGLDGQGRIFVLFKGAPKTLQELAQGGGRGARDGLLGAVVVFSGPHLDMGNPDEGMREFLRTDQCHQGPARRARVLRP